MQKPLDKNRPAQTNRLWRFILEPFEEAEQSSLAYQQTHSSFDIKTPLILITVAISLTIQRFIFGSGEVPQWFENFIIHNLGDGRAETELAKHLYFAWGTLLTYLFIPTLLIKFIFKESFTNYAVKRKGAFKGSGIYFLMLAIMVPLIAFFSTTSVFQAAYPFYHPPADVPLWPRFWVWEISYIFQFFALEFFFRGFMLHGIKHRFGFYSIFVMMVPYCMIHFTKPMPECFGAIVAGIALGFMSLKTRSIWGGFVLHVGVAMSMDFLAMYHLGRLAF